jgi:hypothetical protein
MYSIVISTEQERAHARRRVIATGFEDRDEALVTASRWVRRHFQSSQDRTPDQRLRARDTDGSLHLVSVERTEAVSGGSGDTERR